MFNNTIVRNVQVLLIDLPNVTVAAASLFLDFIYGTNNFSLPDVDSKDRDHLLALATKFGILDLVHTVRQFVTPTKMTSCRTRSS